MSREGWQAQPLIVTLWASIAVLSCKPNQTAVASYSILC